MLSEIKEIHGEVKQSKQQNSIDNKSLKDIVEQTALVSSFTGHQRLDNLKQIEARAEKRDFDNHKDSKQTILKVKGEIIEKLNNEMNEYKDTIQELGMEINERINKGLEISRKEWNKAKMERDEVNSSHHKIMVENFNEMKTGLEQIWQSSTMKQN
jgi:uncharacterized protein YdeI (BOF family)